MNNNRKELLKRRYHLSIAACVLSFLGFILALFLGLAGAININIFRVFGLAFIIMSIILRRTVKEYKSH